MKNITRHYGKLEIVERLNNTMNGNARYLIRIDGVTCRTKPDSATTAYVENYNGKHVKALIGTYYGKATLRDIWLLSPENLPWCIGDTQDDDSPWPWQPTSTLETVRLMIESSKRGEA